MVIWEGFEDQCCCVGQVEGLAATVDGLPVDWTSFHLDQTAAAAAAAAAAYHG